MGSGLAAARRSGMTIRDTVQRGRIRPAWVVLGGAFGAFTLSAALMHSYPGYLVAARAIADLADRLAQHLSGAGRADGGAGIAAGGAVPPRRSAAGAIAERRGAERDARHRCGTARARLDLARSDAHAAFLAALSRLSLHRARQLFCVVAPARLRG